MASNGEQRERLFTLPNLLTLVRLPMAAAVWLAPGRPEVIIPLLIAAALTDVVDGRVARAIRARRVARGEPAPRLAGPRGIGAWLDPLCDKVFVASSLAAVAWAVRPPLAVVLMIALRELFLVPLVAVYRIVPNLRGRKRFDLRAGRFGKLTTVAQFAALAALLVAEEMVWPMAMMAAGAGAAAVVVYTRRAALAAREE
jgi:phosphatidylglycerophosphate synthase